MLNPKTRCLVLVIMALLLWVPFTYAAAPQPAPESQKQPVIFLPKDVGATIAQKAESVKTEIENRASSLFERSPIGWNWNTIEYLYTWIVGLPHKLPDFIKHITAQSRLLGVAGSFVIFIFLAAALYSLLVRKRILAQIQKKVPSQWQKIPPSIYPFFLSTFNIFISALIPLILFGAYSLIRAMIHYRAAWFLLIGNLIILWVIGSLVTGLLRELLTQNLFQASSRYGKKVFQVTRLALLYGLLGVAVIQSAVAFQIRPDVIDLLKFTISVSIVVVLFLIHLLKTALMSFLPDLPYRTYQGFVRVLSRFYYPFIFFSFITALLWCAGYKQFGRVILTKIWFSGATYILIMLAYRKIKGWLQGWYDSKETSDEAAQFLFQAFETMLLYATILAMVGIILNLLGLLDLVERIFSFSVVTMGTTRVTLWLIIKAVITILAFIYAARVLQAYLDYKVYPSLGIESGLGYALNTTFKYTFIGIGVLVSLKVVGLDLRFLLVFAGAAGIGIGLGMQQITANIISGFTIIFGGKIRKGDWLEVEKGLGTVTDIYLRATKVRTRDNIEYLIPNSNLISSTIVNYSLASPMIRIELPLGVSYHADPQQVKEILLKAAAKEPMVSDFQKPAVRFIEYGDSSINFELLIWIDVRVTARRNVRSALYFDIFEAFKKTGIEIPFPQRDLHIRSSTEMS